MVILLYIIIFLSGRFSKYSLMNLNIHVTTKFTSYQFIAIFLLIPIRIILKQIQSIMFVHC